MSEYLISKSGVDIVLVLESESIRSVIESQFSALLVPQKISSAETFLRVSCNSRGWQIEDLKTKNSYVGSTDGDLIYQLSDSLLHHLADRNNSEHCLHAAAVAKDRWAIVMPANSGDGKSTFTAWLVANGFEYLTDELVLIDPQSVVSGIPRPIQIKKGGVSVIESLLSQPDRLIKGERTNSLPIDAITRKGLSNANPYLAAFVFPKFSESEPYRWRKLSSGECGLKVMSNHVNARNLTNYGFAEMANMVRCTPAFELTYSGFDALPDDFVSMLNRVITSE